MMGCGCEIDCGDGDVLSLGAGEIPISTANPLSSPSSFPTFPSTPPPASFSVSPEDVCFGCKRPGHWVRECPNKRSRPSTPTASSSSSSTSMALSNLPVLQCPCGRGACSLLTSSTPQNDGRKFYVCPGSSEIRIQDSCGFFKWCDEVALLNSPLCKCGAGVCSLNRESTGQNAGAWYFACRIKKKHGACQFFQWADPQVNNVMNKHLDRRNEYFSPQTSQAPTNIATDDLDVNEDLFSEIILEPLLLEKSGVPSSLPIITVSSENEQVANRLPVMEDVESMDVVIGKVLQVSCLMSQYEISFRQREFCLQIFAAGDSLTEDAIYLKFVVYGCGWLGRLVFVPCHGMKESPPMPFFCCIFPSFDAISVPEDIDLSGSEGSAIEVDLASQTLGRDTWVSNVVGQPLGLEDCSNPIQDGAVLRSYGKGLIDILKFMEPCDHKMMLEVAEATFEIFNRLKIEHGTFSKRVKEYINHSSRLASIESCMEKDVCSEKLIERYHNEMVKYDNACSLYEEAVNSYNVSNNRLKSLGEEVLRTKELLVEQEKQVFLCEAETLKLKSCVVKREKDMQELEKNMKEMEEAMKVEQERDLVVEASKKALDGVRIWLEPEK